MIKDDFLVKTTHGLYCRYGDFYLDPQLPVSNAVISHAHGDHAKPENQNIYCTAFTEEIMKLRLKKKREEHLMFFLTINLSIWER